MGWTLIQHTALTSSAASVTLGSGGTIPQTYKTLKVLFSSRSDATSTFGDTVLVRPNGATTNLSSRIIYGQGSGAFSTSTSNARSGQGSTTAQTSNTFGNGVLDIPNYSGSTNKPMSADGVSENNAANAIQELGAALWSNTAAITSLTFVPETGTNFVSGSTFTLYGLS